MGPRRLIRFYFIREFAGTWQIEGHHKAAYKPSTVAERQAGRKLAFRTKEDALEIACGLAERHTPSEVILLESEATQILATYRQT